MKNASKNASFDANMRSIDDLFPDNVSHNKELSPEHFLANYMTSDETLDHRKELATMPHGIDYTNIIFHNCFLGLKITSPLLPKIDKFGNKYFWLEFANGGSSKAILTEGFKQFIIDYQSGSIKPTFDYRTLLQTATQAMS